MQSGRGRNHVKEFSLPVTYGKPWACSLIRSICLGPVPGSSSANENLLFLILKEISLHLYPFACASCMSETIFPETVTFSHSQEGPFSVPAPCTVDTMRTEKHPNCLSFFCWLDRFRKESYNTYPLSQNIFTILASHKCSYKNKWFVLFHNASCYRYVDFLVLILNIHTTGSYFFSFS